MVFNGLWTVNDTGTVLAVVTLVHFQHVLFDNAVVLKVITTNWTLRVTGVHRSFPGTSAEVIFEAFQLNGRERALVTEEFAMAGHVSNQSLYVARRVATYAARVGVHTGVRAQEVPLQVPDVRSDMRTSDATEIAPR